MYRSAGSGIQSGRERGPFQGRTPCFRNNTSLCGASCDGYAVSINLTKRCGLSPDIERSTDSVHHTVNNPAGEVCHIQDRRRLGGVGDQDIIPCGMSKPPRVVAGSSSPIAVATNQTGTDDRERFVVISVRFFTRHLCRPILTHVSHDFGLKSIVDLGHFRRRCRIEVGVDTPRGDINPVLGSQSLGCTSCMTGMGSHIDYRTPVSSSNRLQRIGLVSIRFDEHCTGRNVTRTSRHARDRVPSSY